MNEAYGRQADNLDVENENCENIKLEKVSDQ